MKTKYILAAFALILILTGVGGGIAYFNATDTADNVFTVGDVKITLTEEGWDPADQHVMAPGASFDKKPVVENTGENAAYIRAKVTVSHYSLLKEAVRDADFEPAALFDAPGTNWVAGGEPVIEDDSATYSFLYTDPLPAGKKTEALFTKVTFPDTLDQAALSALEGELSVTVSADAIQAEGFDDAEAAFVAFDAE